MGIDRRDIAGLLIDHFPTMGRKDAAGRVIETVSSDEWHGFLNHITGLNIPVSEENGGAFDQWRKALAQMGYPVWDVTPEREAEIKRRGEELAKNVLAEKEKRDATRAAAAAGKLGRPNADGTVNIK